MLYNVVVDWADGDSQIMDFGKEHLGADGNPFGFSQLDDAVRFRDHVIHKLWEAERKGEGTGAIRVSLIVGERATIGSKGLPIFTK